MVIRRPRRDWSGLRRDLSGLGPATSASRPDWHARVPTAPVAAAGLIGGFAVAVGTGSRPLGGVVLAGCGLFCLGVWLRRDGWRTAAPLTLVGLVAFAASHALGPLIGPWPAVLVVSAVAAGACWRLSDARRPGRLMSA